ncbi:MAG: hypothetical protein IKT40_11910 [Bacilli bacterium]|nr:hypothetical protein [Bacilli bacterium]
MDKIATHNSGTAEKGKNFFHRLISIFYKCQNKTILEQWYHGVRFFDLRIDHELNLVSGRWKSKTSLYDILKGLNDVSQHDLVNKTYITITIEGKYSSNLISALVNYLIKLKMVYKNITLVSINRTYPKFEILVYCKQIKLLRDFPISKDFSLKNILRYINIPKLLNKAYNRKYDFNDDSFVMVDFY